MSALAAFWSRFRRNVAAVVALVVLSLIVLAALVGPFMYDVDPFDMVGRPSMPPSGRFLLGTDVSGRDILAGLIHGARVSLLIGFAASLIATAIGLVIGALAGYYGGWVDDLLMRITEVFQVIPRFFLALGIAAIFGASLAGIVFIIGILNWAEIARLLRAEIMACKSQPYVDAARAYGASDAAIIVGEILPNALTPVIVAAALQVASAVLVEASLSFLGAGDPNTMSWGTMLNAAQQYLKQAWWIATFPGAAICLMTLGVALAADGLNDALNPRLKEMG